MTLILTSITPFHVVQVSDRLVTTQRGQTFLPHNAYANKTVVYEAADALVSVGYSGIAYIGRVPTDEWIARLLSGVSVGRLPNGTPAVMLGGIRTKWSLARAVEAITKAVEKLPSVPVDRHGLSIVVAGWRNARPRSRPVAFVITRRDRKTICRQLTKQRGREREGRVLWIGSGFSIATFRKRATQSLADHRDLHRGPEGIESVFVDYIREVSATYSSVGPNLISVILMRPDLGTSGCRFHGQQQHFAEIRGSAGGASTTVPVDHTPWIVTARAIHPPSMYLGGDSPVPLSKGCFVVRGAKAPPGSGIYLLYSGIVTPPPP